MFFYTVLGQKSRGLTKTNVQNILPEDNLDLCIEGCSLDHGGREKGEIEDDDREGFFNTLLQGEHGRFTDEKDLPRIT